MQITVDTNNLSDLDRQLLATVLGEQGVVTAKAEPVEAPAEEEKAPPKKRAARKTAAAKPDPEPEPEPEDDEPAAEENEDDPEDLLGGSEPVTMQDAVKVASDLVSKGKSADVKKALNGFGVKRVSELDEGDLAAFVAQLS